MVTMVVIVEPGHARGQLSWASRLARAWGSDRLVVLCCVTDAVSEAPRRVDGGEGPPPVGLVAEAVREAQGLEGLTTEVLSMRDPDPLPIVLGQVRERGVGRLILAANGLWPALSNQAHLTDRLLRIGKVWLDGGPMFGAGGEGFQRINIACPRALLEQGLERIVLALAGA